MVPVFSLLLILLLSLLVTRVASSALTHTGLSREAARSFRRSEHTRLQGIYGALWAIAAGRLRGALEAQEGKG